MNRNDIIRELGWERGWVTESDLLDRIERIVRLAEAAEREACARVCDKRAADYQMGFEEKYEAQACAYDIRARSEEPKRHPGYIVGDHWLQAAYTRICTGETEDEVMTDYGWQREA